VQFSITPTASFLIHYYQNNENLFKNSLCILPQEPKKTKENEHEEGRNNYDYIIRGGNFIYEKDTTSDKRRMEQGKRI
jgi:hypothetical protein